MTPRSELLSGSAVGSSASMIEGLFMRAHAIAVRFSWPPEICDGKGVRPVEKPCLFHKAFCPLIA